MRNVEGSGWPAWVDGRCVRLLGTLVIAVDLLLLLTITVLRSATPNPADLLAFLAAARLAAAGQAAVAYDWAAFRLEQAAALGAAPEAIGGALGWLNPPHFFFAVLPLAPLDYGWAWLAWIVTTGLLLAAAAWTVLPRGVAVVAVLAAPPVLLTASVGQNGLLVAALFAWTFALLDRRPAAAGLALGHRVEAAERRRRLLQVDQVALARQRQRRQRLARAAGGRIDVGQRLRVVSARPLGMRQLAAQLAHQVGLARRRVAGLERIVVAHFIFLRFSRSTVNIGFDRGRMSERQRRPG